MVGDPRQYVGEPGLGVGDPGRGEGDAGRDDHFQDVDVAVRVGADDSVGGVCQHGHAASVSIRSGSWSALAWDEVTVRHICDGSRTVVRTSF